MKINIIPTFISVIAAALLSYLFYSISGAEETMLKALAISGFISTGFCLECGIGISFVDSRPTVSSFSISMFFFLVFIVEHCCFAIWGISESWLIITTGLLLVVYLLLYYGISKAKM